MKFLILLIFLFLADHNKSDETSLRESRYKIFRLINEFRKENGLSELEYVHLRQPEINLWAKHLERRFEHANNRFACENIAVNYESPEEMFYQWKNSAGHRKNMLLRGIKYCAIGLHRGKYGEHDGAYFGVFRGYYGKLKAV